MLPRSNAGTFGQVSEGPSSGYGARATSGQEQQQGERVPWTSSPRSHQATIPSGQPQNRWYAPANVWYPQRGYTAIDHIFSGPTPWSTSATSAATSAGVPNSQPIPLIPLPATALQRFASCTNVRNPTPNVDCHELFRSRSEGGTCSVPWTQQLQDAMKKEPGVRKYRCKVCPMDFPSRQDLQTHNIRHDSTIKKDFKCVECSKSFSTNNYLIQHSRIHSQERPFGPCEHCGKKFLQLAHLQQHLRTHTGERPYACDVLGCNKTFAQLSNLRNHSRIHEESKPHKCNSCYKSFETDRLLYEHIQLHKRSKHHRVHVCPYCGKSYALATYLAKHLSKHQLFKDSTLPSMEASNETEATSSITTTLLVESTSGWKCGESSTDVGRWATEMHENAASADQSTTSASDDQPFSSWHSETPQLDLADEPGTTRAQSSHHNQSSTSHTDEGKRSL